MDQKYKQLFHLLGIKMGTLSTADNAFSDCAISAPSLLLFYELGSYFKQNMQCCLKGITIKKISLKLIVKAMGVQNQSPPLQVQSQVIIKGNCE